MSYTVHIFQPGDTLYAAQLNEMDAQIAENAQRDPGTYDETVAYTLRDGYIESNGSLHAQGDTTQEKSTTYFEVMPGDQIKVTMTNPNNHQLWLCACERDENFTWITRSAILSYSPAWKTDAYYEATYTVPDGTYSLALTFRSYGSITITVQRSGVRYYAKRSGDMLEKKVNAQLSRNVVKPHDKVYATNHRGWHLCPEETRAAYRQSAAQGFQQVECDIRFTSDNVPVLLHDSTINRTARNTDGTELSADTAIASLSYAEALTYDFGVYKGASFAGEAILSLADFLRLCRDLGLTPYIELESDLTDAQEAAVVSVVEKSGIGSRVVFCSNHIPALQKMIVHFPDNRFGLVPWTYSDSWLSAAVSLFNGRAEIFMSMAHDQVTAEVVAALAEKHIPIEIWVAGEYQIRNADSYVSGFISNDTNAAALLYGDALQES